MLTEPFGHYRIGRRRLLQLTTAGTLATLAPRVLAHQGVPERSLSLHNLQTDERLKAVYWAEGHYIPSELEAINYLLRDFRTEEVMEIDPELLDLLYALRTSVDSKASYYVISGYRSPETNAMLAEHIARVAKHSYHIVGKAVDVRLPGRELEQIRRAALALKRGGVGSYASSDYLHLDTGPVRSW
ncbi:MAG: DUF882 domain-containing protein [Gammaproteobacteria bacterium]|nr:DUF882 domain-containing protein [Gammaproteobacteria bacterium]NIR85306.1 DUF882 domain-containing protein [Gammaproteobacteria bacterium]NIR88422.1 DUF882 domain-containing protein [Gammaproteobacteria bacterium]NIU06372.1 DUF882 domain-containing protein [Gammaproteobacteria bacterium]NIV53271.1 DUF882 domain-containing protein [Gammaproteobacteria bacterium]